MRLRLVILNPRHELHTPLANFVLVYASPRCVAADFHHLEAPLSLTVMLHATQMDDVVHQRMK